MSEHLWSDVRHQAIQAFHGETPGAELEQRVIDVFRRRPQLVIDSIAYVADQRKLGRVKKSCWGVLAAHIEHAETASDDVVATDESERAAAIAKAEHWIDRAGLHLPTEHELLDELFGDHPGHTPPVEYLQQLDREAHGPGRALYGPLLAAAIHRTREHGPEPVPGPGEGPLRRYDTPELRQRMLERWHKHRLVGITLEEDELDRAERWRDSHEMPLYGHRTAPNAQKPVAAGKPLPQESETLKTAPATKQPAAPQPVTADLDF